ncbi:MAG: protein-L-isoaspartate(D-aspartate) O-methyltransferase [Rhodocyclaceae bacterium]|nr:MAG: protein-L-isoaspartate(D-aspartate) O-methyltransferase [Rhodocyclaceae bacterium]
MLHDIRLETAESRDWTGISALEPKVLDAMRDIPRDAFVAEEYWPQAYANHPLPAGFGQTISQPFIVALMTQILLPQAGHTMLEIGTGTGYQSAVLARLVKRLVSIEVIAELAERARKLLDRLGVNNVEIHHADGYLGYPEAAPYDGIIVTACAGEIPLPLFGQLKPGARMVVPVGPPHGAQELMLVEKSADGLLSSRSVLPVAFVPLKREPDKKDSAST